MRTERRNALPTSIFSTQYIYQRSLWQTFFALRPLVHSFATATSIISLPTISSQTYPTSVHSLATCHAHWAVSYVCGLYTQRFYVTVRPQPAPSGFSAIQGHFDVYGWVTSCFSIWQSHCFVKSPANNIQDKRSIVHRKSSILSSSRVRRWSNCDNHVRLDREQFQSTKRHQNKSDIHIIS